MKHLRSNRHEKLRAELTAARKQKGIAQHALSAMLGRSPSYISKIEAGDRRLEVLEFLAIGEALDIEPTAILKRVMEEDD